jgi:hypothetical protein
MNMRLCESSRPRPTDARAHARAIKPTQREKLLWRMDVGVNRSRSQTFLEHHTGESESRELQSYQIFKINIHTKNQHAGSYPHN